VAISKHEKIVFKENSELVEESGVTQGISSFAKKIVFFSESLGKGNSMRYS
jgi:hypothetical protein